MKSQTFQKDLSIGDFGFEDTKKGLLQATGQSESKNHPILRVKCKVTFYWG